MQQKNSYKNMLYKLKLIKRHFFITLKNGNAKITIFCENKERSFSPLQSIMIYMKNYK